MAPPAKPAAVQPSQTLYVSNLAEKIPKPDLRRALYMLFTPYGTVLDVVALKTSKMRGQAHVVFRDIASATVAMRALEGMQFLGRELRISYARGKSDLIAKLDGSFKMPAAGGAAAGKQGEAGAVASGGDKGTALQQAVFGGVPGKQQPEAKGVKRTREDEDEGEESAEEGSDEEEADMDMDESD